MSSDSERLREALQIIEDLAEGIAAQAPESAPCGAQICATCTATRIRALKSRVLAALAQSAESPSLFHFPLTASNLDDVMKGYDAGHVTRTTLLMRLNTLIGPLAAPPAPSAAGEPWNPDLQGFESKPSVERCIARHAETTQCDLRAGHSGKHLNGYTIWAEGIGEPAVQVEGATSSAKDGDAK